MAEILDCTIDYLLGNEKINLMPSKKYSALMVLEASQADYLSNGCRTDRPDTIDLDEYSVIAKYLNCDPEFLINASNTNSRSTYRQTLGYNKFILRQAPLSGVFSPSRGRCRHYADRGADRQTSLSAVALQGQRSDLTELILSVDFVYRTIEN